MSERESRNEVSFCCAYHVYLTFRRYQIVLEELLVCVCFAVDTSKRLLDMTAENQAILANSLVFFENADSCDLVSEVVY